MATPAFCPNISDAPSDVKLTKFFGRKSPDKPMLFKVVKSVEAMTLAAVDYNSTRLKKIVTGEIVSPGNTVRK